MQVFKYDDISRWFRRMLCHCSDNSRGIVLLIEVDLKSLTHSRGGNPGIM